MNEINKVFEFLANGQKVFFGDDVEFINSDGERCIGKIERRELDGSLYFWNSMFPINSYHGARKVLKPKINN